MVNRGKFSLNLQHFKDQTFGLDNRNIITERMGLEIPSRNNRLERILKPAQCKLKQFIYKKEKANFYDGKDQKRAKLKACR